MNWLLLVFIMAFIFWSFQMIIVYRRQMERCDEQVRQVRAIAEEMPEQIIKCGFYHADKQSELECLRLAAEDLDQKENEID
jgi:hypothetical protein